MRKKRNPLSLGTGLILLGLLVYLIFNLDPNKNFLLLNVPFPALPIFLVLIFTFLLSLFSFILNDQRQGILIGFFVTLYLILRSNRLTHPFFLILVVAIFITLELLFKKRK